MIKSPRIDNIALLNAGLELMRQNGKPLTKVASRGRAMVYAMSNGQTVRVRTCNDHILIALADSPAENAKLNIEGTDWLLIVMPETERTPGRILAYLVPTTVAVAAVRQTHKEWLDSSPNTKGDNTTWNVWFRPDGPEKANDFAAKWSQYLLRGTTKISSFAAQHTTADDEQTEAALNPSLVDQTRPMNILEAKRALAAYYGVGLDSIEITIRG